MAIWEKISPCKLSILLFPSQHSPMPLERPPLPLQTYPPCRSGTHPTPLSPDERSKRKETLHTGRADSTASCCCWSVLANPYNTYCLNATPACSSQSQCASPSFPSSVLTLWKCRESRDGYWRIGLNRCLNKTKQCDWSESNVIFLISEGGGFEKDDECVLYTWLFHHKCTFSKSLREDIERRLERA